MGKSPESSLDDLFFCRHHEYNQVFLARMGLSLRRWRRSLHLREEGDQRWSPSQAASNDPAPTRHEPTTEQQRVNEKGKHETERRSVLVIAALVSKFDPSCDDDCTI